MEGRENEHQGKDDQGGLRKKVRENPKSREVRYRREDSRRVTAQLFGLSSNREDKVEEDVNMIKRWVLEEGVRDRSWPSMRPRGRLYTGTATLMYQDAFSISNLFDSKECVVSGWDGVRQGASIMDKEGEEKGGEKGKESAVTDGTQTRLELYL